MLNYLFTVDERKKRLRSNSVNILNVKNIYLSNILDRKKLIINREDKYLFHSSKLKYMVTS